MFKKKTVFLGYGYIKNNLARLREHHTHRDVTDMSDLFFIWYLYVNLYLHFVFIWSKGMTRNETNKNRYEHISQPDETKIMWMRIYQI